jgi:hypothetical protein
VRVLHSWMTRHTAARLRGWSGRERVPLGMTGRDEQDQSEYQDQDAEPTLNAPEEGRPDGIVPEPETADEEGVPGDGS